MTTCQEPPKVLYSMNLDEMFTLIIDPLALISAPPTLKRALNQFKSNTLALQHPNIIKQTITHSVTQFSELIENTKYGYNFPFQVLPFNQPQNIPIGPILIEYGSIKLKIECISIFLTPQFWKKNS